MGVLFALARVPEGRVGVEVDKLDVRLFLGFRRVDSVAVGGGGVGPGDVDCEQRGEGVEDRGYYFCFLESVDTLVLLGSVVGEVV